MQACIYEKLISNFTCCPVVWSYAYESYGAICKYLYNGMCNKTEKKTCFLACVAIGFPLALDKITMLSARYYVALFFSQLMPL